MVLMGIVADGSVLTCRQQLEARVKRIWGLSDKECRAFVAQMMEPGGVAQACETLGLSMGQVLAERRKNPKFRKAWAEVEQQRRALVEMLLMDMVVRGLLPNRETDYSEAREKFLAGLAQNMVDRAQKEAALKAGAKGAVAGAVRVGRQKVDARTGEAKTVGGKAGENGAGVALPDPDELDRLIAAAEQRIKAAEAVMLRDAM